MFSCSEMHSFCTQFYESFTSTIISLHVFKFVTYDMGFYLHFGTHPILSIIFVKILHSLPHQGL